MVRFLNSNVWRYTVPYVLLKGITRQSTGVIFRFLFVKIIQKWLAGIPLPPSIPGQYSYVCIINQSYCLFQWIRLKWVLTVVFLFSLFCATRNLTANLQRYYQINKPHCLVLSVYLCLHNGTCRRLWMQR